MKRVIKFRAWDNYEKKWLLGYEYPNLGGFSMFGECMLFNEWSNILNRFILKQVGRKPEDLILMQFTGLTDKNGVEIYEGDIVRVLYTDWGSNTDSSISLEDYKKSISSYGHVVYNAPEFEMYAPAHKQHGSLIPGTHGEIEVIGNIYEHSNLLK